VVFHARCAEIVTQLGNLRNGQPAVIVEYHALGALHLVRDFLHDLFFCLYGITQIVSPLSHAEKRRCPAHTHSGHPPLQIEKPFLHGKAAQKGLLFERTLLDRTLRGDTPACVFGRTGYSIYRTILTAAKPRVN
jgi:hypothetical protein